MWILGLNQWKKEDETIFYNELEKMSTEELSLYDVIKRLEQNLRIKVPHIILHYCYIVDRINLELEHHHNKIYHALAMDELDEEELKEFIDALERFYTPGSLENFLEFED